MSDQLCIAPYSATTAQPPTSCLRCTTPKLTERRRPTRLVFRARVLSSHAASAGNNGNVPSAAGASTQPICELSSATQPKCENKTIASGRALHRKPCVDRSVRGAGRLPSRSRSLWSLPRSLRSERRNQCHRRVPPQPSPTKRRSAAPHRCDGPRRRLRTS
jgi:hypothetical protein